MKMTKLAAAVLFCSSMVGAAYAADAPANGPATITIQADKPGHAISPTLWGIFFEDINLSADGGIYAELVRNRSFEDSDRPEHWSLLSGGGKGQIAVTSKDSAALDPLHTLNRRSLKVTVEQASVDAPLAVSNAGYYGMSLKQGEKYDLTISAKGSDGFGGGMVVSLQGADGKVYASQSISGISDKWQPFKVTFTSTPTDPKAKLVVGFTSPGTVLIDNVSLFPEKTWKGHGMRPDLMEMLAGLKPAFVRFPGGCWVEGDTMDQAYRWKQTIGPIFERRTAWNLWAYWATNGLGYHEYLQMCEDLGAEPLFVINVGMSHHGNVPLEQMQPMVQDALDAIEYANGPVTSKWGAMRAKAGHPAPFNLKYMEIGNENGGQPYAERYPLFVKAIKAKYPYMHLVADVWGGIPSSAPVETVDEHYYSTPEFFINQASRYDTYDRASHKVYVGEYAVTQNGGKGNLRAAVGEAAFMTGMERNSDVVTMSSYAPLFVHMDHRRWNPDLINFDSSRVYGIPSYYVQQMFSANRGDVVLPTKVEAAEVAGAPVAGMVGVGTWLTQAEFKDMKVTQGDKVLYNASLANGTRGMRLQGGGDWKVAEGALRQSSEKENIRAFFGNRDWHDYTYTLKARKLSGAEGFLIPFGVGDTNAKCWLNLGGWGNREHGLEVDGVAAPHRAGSIETGKWYDIKIELHGRNIKCYLDGKLLYNVDTGSTKPIYAAGSLDKSTGEVIVKVVNTAAEAVQTSIDVAGVSRLAPEAKLELLASQSATDENTLEKPSNVSTVTRTIRTDGSAIRYSFPGNSVSVIRVKPQ